MFAFRDVEEYDDQVTISVLASIGTDKFDVCKKFDKQNGLDFAEAMIKMEER